MPNEALFEHLAHVLHEQVQPHFMEGVKTTLIIRFDGEPEADVYVSNDEDHDAVKAAVDRAKGREVAFHTTLK